MERYRRGRQRRDELCLARQRNDVYVINPGAKLFIDGYAIQFYRR